MYIIILILIASKVKKEYTSSISRAENVKEKRKTGREKTRSGRVMEGKSGYTRNEGKDRLQRVTGRDIS